MLLFPPKEFEKKKVYKRNEVLKFVFLEFISVDKKFYKKKIPSERIFQMT